MSESISELTTGLSASTRVVGFSDHGWAKIEIDGEDSEILESIITRNMMPAQTDLDQVDPQGAYSGIVNRMRESLEVDIGIEKPAPLNVSISLGAVRAQLCDGKPLSGPEIGEYYCIHPGDVLSVRLTRIDRGPGRIEAWLSDSQIKQFSDSMASRLQQVRVYGCTRRVVESALRKAKLERDVISVESPSLTTHSVVCKFGTDAVGLIPQLGRILRKTELKPFLPKRILSKCRPW